MIISDIVDYYNYKIVCILYLIIVLIIFNTNILSHIFGNNITKTQINLFNFSILICDSVFVKIYPFVKIKLFSLSTKKI